MRSRIRHIDATSMNPARNKKPDRGVLHGERCVDRIRKEGNGQDIPGRLQAMAGR